MITKPETIFEVTAKIEKNSFYFVLNIEISDRYDRWEFSRSIDVRSLLTGKCDIASAVMDQLWQAIMRNIHEKSSSLRVDMPMKINLPTRLFGEEIKREPSQEEAERIARNVSNFNSRQND